MKAIFTCLVILFLFSPVIRSQQFDGGVVGGLCASQVDGDTYSGFNKLGLIGGFWVSRDFIGNAGGQMEIRYIGKGAYYANNKTNVYYRLKLHYIEIPVLATYKYGPRVKFNLGVAPEYLIRHMEEDENGEIPESGPSPDFRTFSLTVMGGFGYTFFDALTFNVRYNYSLMPIRDHASGQTHLLNRGQYNNFLTIAVYYRIAL